jgi:hypothetical protein
MIILLPAKAPSEVLPYAAEFTQFLGTGDVIETATVTIVPSDMTATMPTIAGMVLTTFVSGGTIGVAYELSFHISTNAGFVVQRSGTINVEDR